LLWQAAKNVEKRNKINGYGGGSGIRTHGELAPTPVFKTGALNRSAIPPHNVSNQLAFDGETIGDVGAKLAP
jgi:hypothetical protein